MAATYPGTVKTYVDKVDGTSIVAAADINSVQQEVNAIETALGTNPATSLIPASVGTYNAAGVSTSLSARVGNLEAGLTANATDGSRVGYTLLASGNWTSAPGAITVAGASYLKLVMIINFNVVSSASAVSLTVNGATAQRSSYVAWSSTGTIAANSGGTTVFVGNNIAPANGDIIHIELMNPSSANVKSITWSNGTGYGQGTITNGAAVTSVTLAATTYATSATYAIYGVK
jgi:hypothetical protein